MLNLLGIIILLVFVYALVIWVYSKIKNISLEESRIIVVEFLKDIFGLGQQEIMYPVFVGFEDGIPNARTIEEFFSEELTEVFSSIYLADTYIRENIIVYSFCVGEVKKEIETEQLEQYVKGISSSLVHRYLHRNAPTLGRICNLVMVVIEGSYLKIFVATTPSATETIRRYEEHLRKCEAERVLKQNSSNKREIEV